MDRGTNRGRAWPLLLGGSLVGTVASGLLHAAAFPPLGLWPLAWVALAPLFVATRRGGLGSAVLLGFLWSEVVGALVVDALPPAVSDYFMQGELVGWSFSALVYAINAGIYYAAALAAYRALAQHYRMALPLLAAAAWCAAELARGRLLNDTYLVLSTPMGLVPYSQVEWTALIQIASLTGPYGVGFLVVAINAALAELWLAYRGRSQVRGAFAGLGLALLPTAAALGYGYAELHAAEREPAAPLVPVAIVQGNLDLGSKWKPEFYGRNLDQYLKLTLTAFELTRPDVVFWPEAALTFELPGETAFRELIARVLKQADAQLVAGGPRSAGGDPPRFYNSVFLMAQSGEILARYDKQYLLPFAEFAPLPRLDLLRRDFGSFRFWEPGGTTAPLPTRVGAAGVLICNEALLPELAAERVHQGATYLVAPANDGWLAGSWTPWPKWGRLMLDVSSMRAVEQRRYLIRVSTSGPSAIIDPWGRVRASVEPGVSAVLIAGIRARHDRTLYSRLGDAFGLACAAVALAALLSRGRLFSRAGR